MQLTRASALLAAALLTGCGALTDHGRTVKQSASAVDYLYPDAKEAPSLQPAMTTLRPPVRVGIAFAPTPGYGGTLPETEKAKLLEKVRAAFSQQEFIGSIEIIPTQYMRPRGGFNNLDQVARMFNVEVVALLSYDQVRFNDSNALSLLYWTIVGAYVIKGDKYDVQTMVDASVFDVKSRKLLFRAPGTSQVKGSATMAGYSESVRQAGGAGYAEAVEQLIPNLQAELTAFRERIKHDAGFRVENKEGYKGGGDSGWAGVALAALAAGAAWAARRQRRA